MNYRVGQNIASHDHINSLICLMGFLYKFLHCCSWDAEIAYKEGDENINESGRMREVIIEMQ